MQIYCYNHNSCYDCPYGYTECSEYEAQYHEYPGLAIYRQRNQYDREV